MVDAGCRAQGLRGLDSHAAVAPEPEAPKPASPVARHRSLGRRPGRRRLATVSKPVRALLSRLVVGVAALALGACSSERDLSGLPPTGGSGPVTAEIISLDREDDRLVMRVRLLNTGDDAVAIAPGGDRLANFRAIVVDSRNASGAQTRDISARAEVDHHPVAAAVLAGLPGHALVELELTWDLQPDLGRDDYPCTLIIGNLYLGDTHLDDIVIPLGADGGMLDAPADTTAPATGPDPVPSPAPAPIGGGLSL